MSGYERTLESEPPVGLSLPEETTPAQRAAVDEIDEKRGVTPVT